MKHPRKHSIGRHNAFPHLLKDLAPVMAFFPDLGHLELHIAAPELRPDFHLRKIISAHDKIFPERSVCHARPLSVELLNCLV